MEIIYFKEYISNSWNFLTLNFKTFSMNYPNLISSKLPNVGTTIFTVMSKLAADHNAINLSQGFPDFNCADELISLVNKYMKEGKNQYAPMAGLMPLREVISDK